MTYFLKTTYPCLVKAKNVEFEVDESDTVEISDEEFLFVYPTRGLPFYINLNFPKDSDRVSFVTYGKKRYIILESENILKFSLKKLLFFSGKRCVVTANEDQVCFESDSAKIDVMRQQKGEPREIFKIKDYACVKFDCDFYAFSTKTSRISHILGNVNVEEDSLIVTYFCNDSEGRERHAKFNIGDKIELSNEDFFRNQTSKSPSLLPFKLLESVKAKDFSHALSFLSEDLKNKIDAQKIGEFFGNFTEFLPITEREFIIISSQSKNFVTFEIENDKICDINLDLL